METKPHPPTSSAVSASSSAIYVPSSPSIGSPSPLSASSPSSSSYNSPSVLESLITSQHQKGNITSSRPDVKPITKVKPNATARPRTQQGGHLQSASSSSQPSGIQPRIPRGPVSHIVKSTSTVPCHPSHPSTAPSTPTATPSTSSSTNPASGEEQVVRRQTHSIPHSSHTNHAPNMISKERSEQQRLTGKLHPQLDYNESDVSAVIDQIRQSSTPSHSISSPRSEEENQKEHHSHENHHHHHSENQNHQDGQDENNPPTQEERESTNVKSNYYIPVSTMPKRKMSKSANTSPREVNKNENTSTSNLQVLNQKSRSTCTSPLRESSLVQSEVDSPASSSNDGSLSAVSSELPSDSTTVNSTSIATHAVASSASPASSTSSTGVSDMIRNNRKGLSSRGGRGGSRAARAAPIYYQPPSDYSSASSSFASSLSSLSSNSSTSALLSPTSSSSVEQSSATGTTSTSADGTAGSTMPTAEHLFYLLQIHKLHYSENELFPLKDLMEDVQNNSSNNNNSTQPLSPSSLASSSLSSSSVPSLFSSSSSGSSSKKELSSDGSFGDLMTSTLDPTDMYSDESQTRASLSQHQSSNPSSSTLSLERFHTAKYVGARDQDADTDDGEEEDETDSGDSSTENGSDQSSTPVPSTVQTIIDQSVSSTTPPLSPTSAVPNSSSPLLTSSPLSNVASPTIPDSPGHEGSSGSSTSSLPPTNLASPSMSLGARGERMQSVIAADYRSPEFKEAAALFAVKPKQGVAYLVERGLIDECPESVAEYLFNEPNLSKTKLGDFLGEGEEYNIQVLKCYVDQFKFKNLSFDAALRTFLLKFRLPGEAQKIDRMMEAFAQKYHNQNPDGVFHNSDAAYVLAFSLIMLNTDAHNPNIKHKMGKADFIRIGKGMNGGDDIPQQYMEELYDRIVNEEIKMEADDALTHTVFINAEKKGHLVKQGGRIKTWKKRWFLLSQNCLFYFKQAGDPEPCGIIPLENLVVSRLEPKGGTRKYSFMLGPENAQDKMKAVRMIDGGVVQGNHESYLLSASSESEMEAWIEAINANIHRNPFYALIQKKKNLQLIKGPPRVPSFASAKTESGSKMMMNHDQDKEKEKVKDKEKEQEKPRKSNHPLTNSIMATTASFSSASLSLLPTTSITASQKKTYTPL